MKQFVYILRIKFDLGLFENAMPSPTMGFATSESRQTALQAARESMTLLKNSNDLLPLAKGRKILITGPTANSLISLNNGWTYVWQGNNEALYPKDRQTILQAIQTKARNNATYVPGVTFDKEIDIQAAVNAAREADVAVVCVGESSYAETPGNITDLTLSDTQLKLAQAIEATGKPVVLVLVEGRPRIINRITDGAQAILMAYNPATKEAPQSRMFFSVTIIPAASFPSLTRRLQIATLPMITNFSRPKRPVLGTRLLVPV